jgi:hypothetical protein
MRLRIPDPQVALDSIPTKSILPHFPGCSRIESRGGLRFSLDQHAVAALQGLDQRPVTKPIVWLTFFQINLQGEQALMVIGKVSYLQNGQQKEQVALPTKPTRLTMGDLRQKLGPKHTAAISGLLSRDTSYQISLGGNGQLNQRRISVIIDPPSYEQKQIELDYKLGSS